MKVLKISIMVVLFTAILSCMVMAMDKTDLVLYLNFDEGKGDKTKDLSGNGNDGMLMGDAEWVVDGKYKGGVYLATIPDHIEVEDSDSLDITDGLTLAIWANIESLPDGSCALFQKPTAYMIHTTNGGVGVKVDPLIFVGGAYGAWPTPANASATFGEWHHFAATYDGEAYEIYIDGELADGYERSPAGEIDVDAREIFIGRDNRDGCTERNQPCTLDEAMIWARVLSDGEIQEAMEGGLAAVKLEGKLSTSWGEIKKY